MVVKLSQQQHLARARAPMGLCAWCQALWRACSLRLVSHCPDTPPQALKSPALPSVHRAFDCEVKPHFTSPPGELTGQLGVKAVAKHRGSGCMVITLDAQPQDRAPRRPLERGGLRALLRSALDAKQEGGRAARVAARTGVQQLPQRLPRAPALWGPRAYRWPPLLERAPSSSHALRRGPIRRAFCGCSTRTDRARGRRGGTGMVGAADLKTATAAAGGGRVGLCRRRHQDGARGAGNPRCPGRAGGRVSAHISAPSAGRARRRVMASAAPPRRRRRQIPPRRGGGDARDCRRGAGRPCGGRLGGLSACRGGARDARAAWGQLRAQNCGSAVVVRGRAGSRRPGMVVI